MYCNTQVTLQKWLLLMFLGGAREYPVTDAAKDAEVSERMAIDMYGWYRDVCTQKLLSAPIVLGGPGVIIQIKKSLFCHKLKVNFIIVSKSYRII